MLLIAAISGRALASAARRAGYGPLIADFFCDTDTVALAERTVTLPGDLKDGIDSARVIETLRTLAGDESPAAVVLGSGFERKPDLVDAVARHFPLAGNSGGAIRRVKDPQTLAADCAELCIPHPEFRRDRPPDPQNWIVKTAGAAGGTHVRRANGENPAEGRYFQRFLRGQSVSALFVGDGRKARIAGFSRQWTSPVPSAPYRYGGAVRLRRFDRQDAARIGGWLSALTQRAGLIGLCSADFIRNADGYHLIEINPRPGATLDIFDSPEAPLMEAHLRASRGEDYHLPNFTDSMAQMVAYTASSVKRFPAIDWPDWTADRQLEGTQLLPGDPVCTVLAHGPSALATRKAVKAQARALRTAWEGGRA
jgi:predicted ATP-grasp superfamily ATP-dependent carboligase